MPRTDVKPADVAWAVSFATVVVERLVCVPFPPGSHPLPDGAPEVDPTPGNPTCARIPWPQTHRPDASSRQPKTERKSRSGFIKAFFSVWFRENWGLTNGTELGAGRRRGSRHLAHRVPLAPGSSSSAVEYLQAISCRQASVPGLRRTPRGRERRQRSRPVAHQW